MLEIGAGLKSDISIGGYHILAQVLVVFFYTFASPNFGLTQTSHLQIETFGN